MGKELFQIKVVENKKGSVATAINKACTTDTLMQYINAEYMLVKGFSKIDSLIDTDDKNVILDEDFQYKLLDTIDELLEDVKLNQLKEIARLYRNNLIYGADIARSVITWEIIVGGSELYPKGFFEVLQEYAEEYEPLNYDVTMSLKMRLKSFIGDLAYDLYHTYKLDTVFDMVENGKYRQVELQQFFNTWISEKKIDIFELALWCRNITEMYPIKQNVLAENPEEAKEFLEKFPDVIRQDIIDNAVEITEKEFREILSGKRPANYDYLEKLLERGGF